MELFVANLREEIKRIAIEKENNPVRKDVRYEFVYKPFRELFPSCGPFTAAYDAIGETKDKDVLISKIFDVLKTKSPPPNSGFTQNDWGIYRNGLTTADLLKQIALAAPYAAQYAVDFVRINVDEVKVKKPFREKSLSQELEVPGSEVSGV